MKLSSDITERFWERVDRRGPDDCWLWKLGTFGFGYGRFTFQKVTVQAHRFSWELRHGPIPDGLCVLHRCDTPPCCNPAHLFLGTILDNIVDMDQKGRRGVPSGRRHRSRTQPWSVARGEDHWTHARPGRIAKGERNGMALLTAADVLDIRRQLAAGERGVGKALAERYGVSRVATSNINTGKRWAHIST